MNNTRTVTLPVSDEFENADTLLSAIADFDGEARYWENVTVKAVDGDVRVALMAPGRTTEPTSDSSSVSIALGESRTFAAIDFESCWLRAGDTVESGGEGSGSEETSLVEIVGTTASKPNTF